MVGRNAKEQRQRQKSEVRGYKGDGLAQAPYMQKRRACNEATGRGRCCYQWNGVDALCHTAAWTGPTFKPHRVLHMYYKTLAQPPPNPAIGECSNPRSADHYISAPFVRLLVHINHSQGRGEHQQYICYLLKLLLPPTAMNCTLCEHCQVLEINDCAWGGGHAYGFKSDGTGFDYMLMGDEVEYVRVTTIEDEVESIGDTTMEDEVESIGETTTEDEAGFIGETAMEDEVEFTGETTMEEDQAWDEAENEGNLVWRLTPHPFGRPLPYDRQDTLPDLPVLQRGRQSGCAFCGLLESSIITRLKSGELQASEALKAGCQVPLFIHGLHYKWVRTDFSKFVGNPLTGLVGVIVDLAIGSSGAETQQLFFEALAPSGKSRLGISSYFDAEPTLRTGSQLATHSSEHSLRRPAFGPGDSEDEILASKPCRCD